MCKIAATLTFDTTDILLDKTVTRMSQKERNLNVLSLFSLKNELKFRDMVLLLKVNEAWYINKWLHSFVYVLATYMWKIAFISIHWLFCKNTPVWQKVFRVKKNSNKNYYTAFEFQNDFNFNEYLFWCHKLNPSPSIVFQISSCNLK